MFSGKSLASGKRFSMDLESFFLASILFLGGRSVPPGTARAVEQRTELRVRS